MHLPVQIDEISASWLSEALTPICPGVEVQSAHVVDVMLGTSTKIRMALTYNPAGNAAALPPQFLKCGNHVAMPLAGFQRAHH